ncbi:MAG: TRAP transporter small permease [Paracoccus sp. (in: a-proteobacteria)]|uniref:TRAP transporter small permease n=1 Tax=Paracoccus sp. TaxID=267 RepID=UPI0026E05CD2|nr:TRAP transporter small permease [Paracoccus sp. (in: a-proteobacteria)]MDO5611905.1 TRAP transporter small permease [Paracoccus sp. (in: a-proteobacteria)]
MTGADQTAPADQGPPQEKGLPVPVPRWLLGLARAFAIAGGAVLMAMMLMTVISITRRSLLGAPIAGDFEMVELACAITVFCFLPWCQITRGNVLVDFFTMRASPRLNHMLEAVGDLIYALIGGLILWRLWHGAMDFHQYNEQTMIRRIPIWWSFVIIFPAFSLLIVTTVFTMIGHLRMAWGRV